MPSSAPSTAIDQYEAVIGLEVHAQLQTKSKLFSGDATAFGAAPNTQVSPITLGHPGTLPRMNKIAIEHAISMGLVCQCTLSRNNYFSRKNYFYPDLPKGYQISQHTTPICTGGTIPIKTSAGQRNIALTRIHLEEDAGKSLHDQDAERSYLDFNRAGVPLIEIVSEPDIHSAEEASAYLNQVRKLVRWIGVCDGNMEEGSLRCDANISVRLKGDTRLGTRVEVKNLNSVRNLRHAIELEVSRLVGLIEKGEKIVQETRSYDADRGTTVGIRTKEDAEDYRYFPEPDLAPFSFTDEQILAIKQNLPVLPDERIKVYTIQYGLTEYDAEQLTEERALSDYFEQVAAGTQHKKQLANMLIGPVRAQLSEQGGRWESIGISPENWSALLNLVAENKVSFSTAVQKLLPSMMAGPDQEVLALAKRLDLLQDADKDQLEAWVSAVLEQMPEKVAEYHKGKKGLIGLFIGEIKKISRGKADLNATTEILNQYLQKK
jgi:aspartyl-tRNA(Asn)/glutamyl-tRNA(Gln) amidotransferase subunit B